MPDAPRLPSLVSVQAFEAAARHGGFARAAEELGTTAASVSYHVKQLEQQVGAALFRRFPHRVELTGAGAILAEEATAAFAGLRASFARAAEHDEARLSITALPTFGTAWLIPRLGAFRAAHPDIRIEVDLSADAKDLSAGQFDLAIRNGHGGWRGLKATRLMPSVFMPLCSPRLAEARRALEHPDRCNLPLLGRPDWWSLWFHARGLAHGPSEDQFGTTLSAEHLDVAAAIAGHGIAIGSPILFQDEIDAGRLAPAHDLVATDGRAFWLTFPQGRRASRKITVFEAWIAGQAQAALEAARPYLHGLA
jgi:LysR family glycine cleavage system transcriptional activator